MAQRTKSPAADSVQRGEHVPTLVGSMRRRASSCPDADSHPTSIASNFDRRSCFYTRRAGTSAPSAMHGENGSSLFVNRSTAEQGATSPGLGRRVPGLAWSAPRARVGQADWPNPRGVRAGRRHLRRCRPPPRGSTKKLVAYRIGESGGGSEVLSGHLWARLSCSRADEGVRAALERFGRKAAGDPVRSRGLRDVQHASREGPHGAAEARRA